MSHCIVGIEKLIGKQYRFDIKQIAELLFGGARASELVTPRPDSSLVYGFSSLAKSEKIAQFMVNRSAAEGLFSAALLFDSEPKLDMAVGFTVVNKHVRVIERVRSGNSNIEVGPFVDTSNVVLFGGEEEEMKVACSAVIDRFELERPVAIEPETSAPEVQKALLDVYGPGTQGKFAVALNGRAVLATAFGVTI
jgi:hypothetical protein